MKVNYVEHKELRAAQGVKICAKELDKVSSLLEYRSFHQIVDLGWDFSDLGCTAIWLILLRQMGFWHKQLSNWARWWNIQNLCQPNPSSPSDRTPCRISRYMHVVIKLVKRSFCELSSAENHLVLGSLVKLKIDFYFFG